MKIPIFLIISIIAIFVVGTSHHLIFDADAQEETSTNKFIVLSSYTEKILSEQRVTIKGNLFNTENKPVEETVELKVFDLSTSTNAREVYSNVVYAQDGQFQDNGFIPTQKGVYTIVAETASGISTTSNIRAVDFFETNSFRVLGISIISFAILVSLTGMINSPRIKLGTYRLLRFTLITIIAFGMVSVFLFTDVEVGTQSSLGIVIKEYAITPNTSQELISNENLLADELKLDWILHIGGHSADNYAAGLQIPLSIIIAGMIGGYVRILNYASKSWIKEALWNELGDSLAKPDTATIQNEFDKIMDDANTDGKFNYRLTRVLTNRIISDLALLFIAPALAIIVYFILLQSGLNPIENVWTLTVAAFASGIFTETVIKSIHGYITHNSLFDKKTKNGE